MAKRMSAEYWATGSDQPEWHSEEGLKLTAQRLARKSADGTISVSKLAGYSEVQKQVIIAEFHRVWHPAKTVYSRV